jgi:hypothetical protein
VCTSLAVRSLTSSTLGELGWRQLRRACELVKVTSKDVKVASPEPVRKLACAVACGGGGACGVGCDVGCDVVCCASAVHSALLLYTFCWPKLSMHLP